MLEGRLEDASFTFERDVAKGIERLAERARRDHVRSPAPVPSRTRPSGCRRSSSELGGGEAVAARRRGSRRPIRRRSSSASFRISRAHIGAEYARLAGFPEAVCAAIAEQYLPDSAGGPLPETETGRVLAAADKVDNLTVAFALGQRPTGLA